MPLLVNAKAIGKRGQRGSKASEMSVPASCRTMLRVRLLTADAPSTVGKVYSSAAEDRNDSSVRMESSTDAPQVTGYLLSKYCSRDAPRSSNYTSRRWSFKGT